MFLVRCNDCYHVFSELDMLGKETCPFCGRNDCLMDIDRYCIFERANLIELWKLFEDIPINDKDEIQESFLGFDKGTDRFEIWHWFDRQYKYGIIQLIQDAEKKEEER